MNYIKKDLITFFRTFMKSVLPNVFSELVKSLLIRIEYFPKDSLKKICDLFFCVCISATRPCFTVEVDPADDFTASQTRFEAGGSTGNNPIKLLKYEK